MAPKTSTFFDLKTCLGKSYKHRRGLWLLTHATQALYVAMVLAHMGEFCLGDWALLPLSTKYTFLGGGGCNTYLLAGLFFFLILDVALLGKQPSHLRDRQVTMVLEESLVSFFSPSSLFFEDLFFEERLGCFLKALLSLLPHFSKLHVLLLSPKFLLGDTACTGDDFRDAYSLGATVSLASHLLDIFFTVVWLGLATCSRRTSAKALSVGSLHALVFCFTWFHKVLGWSSCLALSNQQACIRPCCFTGRSRPLETGFLNGFMVLSFDLLLPPLRFLTYGFLATGSPDIHKIRQCSGKPQNSCKSMDNEFKLVLHLFFLLHAAKVRSSCEEGSGQSALQSAYHNPKLDASKMKQNTRSSCSGQKLQSNKLTNQIRPTPE